MYMRLVYVILQYLLQYHARIVDTALHRAYRYVHHECYLIVLVPMDKHCHCFASSGREAVNGIANVVVVVCGHIARRRLLGIVNAAQAVKLTHGKHPLLAVCRVYVRVAHDDPHPFLEIDAVPELFLAYQNLQCRLLHKIVGPVTVVSKRVGVSP